MSIATKKGIFFGNAKSDYATASKYAQDFIFSVRCRNGARVINIQKTLFVISMLGRIIKESKDIHAEQSVH